MIWILVTDTSLARAASADLPTLFLVHCLGGSARSWDAVAARLGNAAVCRAIDLPGFGDAAPLGPRTVEEMTDHVAAIVREAAPRRWLLAGHSMGAKVAALLARRAGDGAHGLAGLSGLVLVAGSPPSPEPMDETRRRSMLAWFTGDAAKALEEAGAFVRQNVGAPLDETLRALAVDDLLRMDRAAWRAWLTHGSREDWSSVVGRLATPALIVAGGEDADLGAEAQSRLTAPHFDGARIVTLDGAGHLLPVERPAELADLILSHIGACTAPGLLLPDPVYRALIRSDRVSARTRAVLLGRARRDDPDRAPEALSGGLFAVLRAVLDRVIPQRTPGIDLAARIDVGLAEGEGDGWRFADLPPDAEACTAGLATLDATAWATHGTGFADLDGVQRDALLRRVERGEVGTGDGDGRGLSAAQMKRWFEDLRAAAVRIYVSHPATLSRIGYSGIANGGDGPRQQGFVETHADRPEPWEPRGIAEPRA